MLTLDAVRAALISDKPWTRLDELVRAEQSAGRKVKEIYADFARMADEIDRTPGLTKDGSDAFSDTLDALTGMSRREQCYRDPPNTAVPTEAELAELPRWARVAFAARCVRRALPLLDTLDTQITKAVYADVVAAIDYAEQNAGECLVPPSLLASAHAYLSDPAISPTGRNAIVIAALAAARSVHGDTSAAVSAIERASASKIGSGLHAVFRRDFDHLARLAESQKWTDNTPVPPEVFGPLWPEGPPKGWPSITDVQARTELAIVAFARERATEQMIEDEAVNLFNALNRYHIARSGMRLTLEQFRSLIAALVPAEV